MKSELYKDQIDWNMAKAFLQRLDDNLRDRDTFRKAGDMKNWFFCLGTIYSNIEFRIIEHGGDKLKKEFRELLDDAEHCLLGLNDRDQGRSARVSLAELLMKLDYKINKFLNDSDLLGMRKTVNDPAQAVRNKFSWVRKQHGLTDGMNQI